MKKSNNVVTEKFLEEKLLDLRNGIRDEIYDMRGGIVSQMDEKSREYGDEILTGLDKVIKELEGIREDNIIGTDQTRELRVDVDGYEQRITKLESATH